MHTPNTLISKPWDGYALIDSGNLRKLERFGEVIVDRPEPQALWKPTLPPIKWQDAHAMFATKDADDDDGRGNWQALRDMPEEWPVTMDGITCLCRLSAFRHMGLFPEQRTHWQWMHDILTKAVAAGRKPRVLNLFGYTGAASLYAARAGAEVTHLDASKKAVQWAKDNQAASGLDPTSVRWIVDDAQSFVAREQRRERVYDLILLDPPKHGNGPDGEVWELSDHLANILDGCRNLMSDTPMGIVLTAYALRLSALTLHHMLRERFTDGTHDFGELLLADESTQGDKAIPISMYARWQA